MFASFLIEEQISNALLDISSELENKAGRVALHLEDKLSQVCERVRLMALNPLIQEGDTQTVADLLTGIMRQSSLCEALLVIDYDGSLIAEAPEGWYHHYLEHEARLVSSQGHLLSLDGINGQENYIFAKTAQVSALGKKERLIVAFTNLSSVAESSLLGNRGEKISMFTEDYNEIVLVDGQGRVEAPLSTPLFSVIVTVMNRVYKENATAYLQGTAVVSKQEWVVTVSETLDSFLTATMQATFSGFRFYLMLLFPVIIILMLMILAINHSRQYFKELASRDGLTGLFNHRFFQTELRILVTDKRNSKVSLVMLDLDDFKCFNDTYGHQAGDEMLKQVSSIVLKNTRSRDIAARYGGEEFVVILPDIDLDGALKVAERIRVAVKAQCTSTVSLGVSSFPEYASTAEELIFGADQALYRAKSMSKDRVESVGEIKQDIEEVQSV